MREKKEAVVVRPMAFVFVVFSYLLSKNSESISLILHFLQIDYGFTHVGRCGWSCLHGK